MDKQINTKTDVCSIFVFHLVRMYKALSKYAQINIDDLDYILEDLGFKPDDNELEVIWK